MDRLYPGSARAHLAPRRGYGITRASSSTTPSARDQVITRPRSSAGGQLT
ncbi:MAG: hypothetical protein R3B06_07620 [Kofleriaceae bacterium]